MNHENEQKTICEKREPGTASLGVGELFSSSTIAPSINESNETPAADNDGQVLFVGDDIAIANTEYGKIQGYQLHGIYTFLGIPYGADTTGANRFMPPKKPTPWTDIRPPLSTAIQHHSTWRNVSKTISAHSQTTGIITMSVKIASA